MQPCGCRQARPLHAALGPQHAPPWPGGSGQLAFSIARACAQSSAPPFRFLIVANYLHRPACRPTTPPKCWTEGNLYLLKHTNINYIGRLHERAKSGGMPGRQHALEITGDSWISADIRLTIELLPAMSMAQVHSQLKQGSTCLQTSGAPLTRVTHEHHRCTDSG